MIRSSSSESNIKVIVTTGKINSDMSPCRNKGKGQAMGPGEGKDTENLSQADV